MEFGIREATGILLTDAATTGEKHIILLTTGEYRLPDPCPPECFGQPDIPDCWGATDCDDILPGCQAGGTCNRACHIRYYANLARQAGIRVSTIRLGNDWRNRGLHGDPCTEDESPYSSFQSPEPNYCTQPDQPDRGGLLKEIANIANIGGCGNADPSCVPTCDQPVGNHVWVNPPVVINCARADCVPGDSVDIADVITEWVCGWSDTDTDGDTVFDMCDNCPGVPNPRQRDCNRNGVGDWCEWPELVTCGANTGDEDCDQVPDADDICADGDDCLIAQWTDDVQCGTSSDSTECDCDCDHDGSSDLCQAAQLMASYSLPAVPYHWDDPAAPNPWDALDANEDGTLDCCVALPVLICDCQTAGCCDGNGECDCTLNPGCCIPNPARCDCDSRLAACDLDELVDNNQGDPFVETFDCRANGEDCDIDCVGADCESYCNAGICSVPFLEPDPVTWIVRNNKGWLLQTDSLAVDLPVQVMEESPTSRFLHIGIDDGDCVDSEDPLNCNMPTDGSKVWYVEGPGFQIPMRRCTYTACYDFGYGYNVWRGDWGAYAVELTLRLHLNPVGATYELLIMDSCAVGESEDDAARVHLRFQIDPNDASKGRIETVRKYWHPAGFLVQEFVPVNTSSFVLDEWFNLKLVFNPSRAYAGDWETGCEWNGRRDIVKLFRKPKANPTYGSGSTLEELGGFVPHEPRGLQLRIRTDNKNSTPPGSFDIEDVALYPISWCEWRGGDACLSDKTCTCGWELGSGNVWHCRDPSCGDGTLNAIGRPDFDSNSPSEECEPWDGQHCDMECNWICGDGIIQADVDADGNGIFDHCDAVGITDPNSCARGYEECEWPHTYLPPDEEFENRYCAGDCTIFTWGPCQEGPARCAPNGCDELCGDGVVQSFCEEECDSGSDACDSATCKLKEPEG